MEASASSELILTVHPGIKSMRRSLISSCASCGRNLESSMWNGLTRFLLTSHRKGRRRVKL